MKLNRNELLQALDDVRPGLASKEVIKQSTCFVFHEGRVFTFNDNISVSRGCVTGFNGAIPSNELYSLLSRIKDEEIEIGIRDSQLSITSIGGGTRAGIRMSEEILLPIEEIAIPDKWYRIPPRFCEAIHLCLFSVSNNMTRPMLTCVHLNGSVSESCDGARATFFQMDGGNLSDILIPSNSAKALVKYDIKAYAYTDGWIHFRFGNEKSTISIRTMEGDYPDITQWMNMKEGDKIEFPIDIDDTIDTAKIAINDQYEYDQSIKVLLKRGLLYISADGERTWVHERKKCRYKGKPITFMINPNLLKDICAIINQCSYSEENNVLKFQSENFTHLLLTMKEKK